MKYSLVLPPEIEQDIESAFDWYEMQREGLGAQFLHDLRARLALITAQPLLFQIRYDVTRICFLTKFPYGKL